MVLRVLVFRKMLSDREAICFTVWYTGGRLPNEDIQEPGTVGAKTMLEMPMDSFSVDDSFRSSFGGAYVAPAGLS